MFSEQYWPRYGGKSGRLGDQQPDPFHSANTLLVLPGAGDWEGEWNFRYMPMGPSTNMNVIVWYCVTSEAWSGGIPAP